MSLKPLTLSASLLLSVPAFAQDPVEAAAKGGIDMEKIMAETMKLATPGKEHAELAEMVGDWDVHLKFRMGADQPWQEAKGRAACKTILGGRYVVQEIDYEFMGMPVQGFQILGYDNLKKEYTATWYDTWSTWSVSSRGVKDEGGNLVYKGQMVDLITPEGRPFRMIVEPKGADESFIRMFDTIDGEDVEVMQITQKRGKDKAKGGEGGK